MTDPTGDDVPAVLVVVGTRPEIVKLAPVIRSLRRTDALDDALVHTGQHYDDELSGSFFETLSLPAPDVSLDVGSSDQSRQTADALAGLGDVLRSRDPDVVLAQGDTNTVLAAALATSKHTARFGHVEAGIRSFDRSMPEEVNRVVADRVSDWLFAPTSTAVDNLAAEGLTEGVVETGNTVVDACLRHRELAAESSDVLDRFDLAADEYVLSTIHRPRNTDDRERLRTIVETLDSAPYPVVLPAHPRLQNALGTLGVEPTGSLRVVDPLDYLDFLALLSDARLVVTDSGGVQEEASILEVPCLTVRPNTERPETVDAGVNELVEPTALGDRLRRLCAHDDERREMTGAPTLYGDGEAARRIVDTLVEELEA
ncbi:UDP-N-acetylglucosamine 2-epimerase (non-hydrolysing) [Halogranum rubrum]|uniref:UDP-N-acetylglucosamine 2-epimerase (Non-hydrolysing) n=1 Tax=Halogranum rubrum TaxID=553466 RepID=A0A1I4BQC6_9EURY|nr:UDP-N-acetylglucosamine 2-epimerase (non-hydrolyzing) [Halogranum rubrum]SFK70407.1 UDP-N-acetylglucosamine 2-epimerase (non-hydrolysing) [Halogranum rubrum]